MPDIEAFYGYDPSTGQCCVSYTGLGDVGEYTWIDADKLPYLWIKLCKLQGIPKQVKTFDGIRRYGALYGRSLLTALSTACPELTDRLSTMEPFPLAHINAKNWPVMICKVVYAPTEVQAGDYIISTSPDHCEFKHFDETTQLSDVYMVVRVVHRFKAKTPAKAAKKERQRALKRQKRENITN
jgi:hypothetical protein